MQEAVANVLAAIMLVLLCIMVLTLFILSISVLIDSIREWKEQKSKHKERHNDTRTSS